MKAGTKRCARCRMEPAGNNDWDESLCEECAEDELADVDDDQSWAAHEIG